MTTKYILRCPECGSTVLTKNPDALVWERCQGCYKHAWDQYDIQMADAYPAEKRVVTGIRLSATN